MLPVAPAFAYFHMIIQNAATTATNNNNATQEPHWNKIQNIWALICWSNNATTTTTMYRKLMLMNYFCKATTMTANSCKCALNDNQKSKTKNQKINNNKMQTKSSQQQINKSHVVHLNWSSVWQENMLLDSATGEVVAVGEVAKWGAGGVGASWCRVKWTLGNHNKQTDKQTGK